MNRGRRRLLVALGAAAVGGSALGAVVARTLTAVPPNPSATGARPIGVRRIQGAQLATRIEGAITAPHWSPTGDAIAVEHVRSGARVVVVYDVSTWTSRFEATGSLPAWAPGGDRLAVIDPFPATTPPQAPLAIRIIDARSGSNVRTTTAPTATLGWGSSGLRGVVDGEIVSLDGQSPRRLPGCDGQCGVVLWSADSHYVASVDLRVEESEYQVRNAETGEILANLGAARGPISWSASGAALIGAFDRGSLIWRPAGTDPLALPSGHLPVSAGPEGDVVLGSTSGAVPLQWSQWSSYSSSAELVDLPLRSSRGVTWDPRSRYITSLAIGFGTSGTLEIFRIEVS